MQGILLKTYLFAGIWILQITWEKRQICRCLAYSEVYGWTAVEWIWHWQICWGLGISASSASPTLHHCQGQHQGLATSNVCSEAVIQIIPVLGWSSSIPGERHCLLQVRSCLLVWWGKGDLWMKLGANHDFYSLYAVRRLAQDPCSLKACDAQSQSMTRWRQHDMWWQHWSQAWDPLSARPFVIYRIGLIFCPDEYVRPPFETDRWRCVDPTWGTWRECFRSM